MVLYKLGISSNTFAYGVIIFSIIYWHIWILSTYTTFAIWPIVQFLMSILFVAIIINLYFEDYYFYKYYDLNDEYINLSSKLQTAINDKSTSKLNEQEKELLKEFKKSTLMIEINNNEDGSFATQLKEFVNIIKFLSPLIPLILANLIN